MEESSIYKIIYSFGAPGRKSSRQRKVRDSWSCEFPRAEPELANRLHRNEESTPILKLPHGAR